MRSARPLASQYPVLKVRAAGRSRAARQGDILPYPGRRGGVFPALHGSYTYGGRAPSGHVHGGQSHREPGVGAQWESARMGTGARAPRAIGTEHAGHEGQPSRRRGRPRARGCGTVGRPRHRDRGRDDGPCADGRRKAPRGAPLATARIKGPGAAPRAFNGLRGGLPRRRLPRRLKGDGGRGRARRAGKANQNHPSKGWFALRV